MKRVMIEPDEDGVFVATVPSLPGCISQGSSRVEALENAREAIEGYLESLRERDEPIAPAINEEVIDIAVCRSTADLGARRRHCVPQARVRSRSPEG